MKITKATKEFKDTLELLRLAEYIYSEQRDNESKEYWSTIVNDTFKKISALDKENKIYETIETVTFEEVRRKFIKYNEKNNILHGYPSDVPTIEAVIVYKKENFNEEYSEEERSYKITNQSGKAFFRMPSGSQSIIGNCLDGKDLHVRLDILDWEIDYCYFVQNEEKE
jgi:hypothetical protein